jgi:hypothetical protein
VTFDEDLVVSVFETNIRVLGGLLGAHALMLDMRQQVADGSTAKWATKPMLLGCACPIFFPPFLSVVPRFPRLLSRSHAVLRRCGMCGRACARVWWPVAEDWRSRLVAGPPPAPDRPIDGPILMPVDAAVASCELHINRLPN